MSLSALFQPLLLYLPLILLLPILYALKPYYHTLHLPNGPTPLPLLGNILSLPRSRLYLHLSSLIPTYGKLFTIYLGRSPTLVISSPNIAYELLSLRGEKYSSRPRAPVFGELFARNNSLTVQPYGAGWQLRRRLLHRALKAGGLERWKPYQEAEATVVLHTLLKKPGNWSPEISRYAASVIFTLSFGHRVSSLETPIVVQRFKNLRIQDGFARPGRFLADMFPVLIHLPDFLAPWKRRVNAMGEAEAKFNGELVERVRAERESGRGKNKNSGSGSFVDTLLELQETEPEAIRGLDARALASLPSTLFSGGVDTTVSTLRSAILLLLLHPAVLERARSEIHTHLSSFTSGFRRSPGFEDLPKLEYLQALMQEVLRLKPAVPLMIPRSTTSPDTYLYHNNRYEIPAKTTLFVNTFAMHHDREYFPYPEEFAPQRFLNQGHKWWEEKYRGREWPGKGQQGGFGWGRRSCPGEGLAGNGMGVLLAKIVWGFDLCKEDGEELEKVGMEGGIISRPGEFGAVFQVREGCESVIKREMKNAESVLSGVEAWE